MCHIISNFASLPRRAPNVSYLLLTFSATPQFVCRLTIAGLFQNDLSRGLPADQLKPIVGSLLKNHQYYAFYALHQFFLCNDTSNIVMCINDFCISVCMQ